MIFITIMHQFNVIIHVKRVCGYVVDFSGYAYLKWQGLEGTYKCFRASKGSLWHLYVHKNSDMKFKN